MKIEVSDLASKQILTTAKKKKLEHPVLTVESSCNDYCCGPPLLNVSISDKSRISSDYELVGKTLQTPVYVEQDVLPISKKATLIVNLIGPKRELTAILIVS